MVQEDTRQNQGSKKEMSYTIVWEKIKTTKKKI